MWSLSTILSNLLSESYFILALMYNLCARIFRLEHFLTTNLLVTNLWRFTDYYSSLWQPSRSRLRWLWWQLSNINWFQLFCQLYKLNHSMFVLLLTSNGISWVRLRCTHQSVCYQNCGISAFEYFQNIEPAVNCASIWFSYG